MRGLTKKYASKFPSSPKTVEDINEYFNHPMIISTVAQTLRGENEETTKFFKHAARTEDFAYCLFASDDVIKILNTIPVEERYLFGDATFHSVPHGEFRQMMILSVDICGQVIYFILFKMPLFDFTNFVSFYTFSTQRVSRFCML